MDTAAQARQPWNKGLIVGQKRPLLRRRLMQWWAVRSRGVFGIGFREKQSGDPTTTHGIGADPLADRLRRAHIDI